MLNADDVDIAADFINSSDVDTIVGETPEPDALNADVRVRWDAHYLYLGIDNTVPGGRSWVKFGAGEAWRNDKLTIPGGKGELYVNGQKVDEVEMPQMHISTYSLAETFDIGRDTGTQVSRMYDGPFAYSDKLDRVVIRISDTNVVPPRKMPAWPAAET